MSKNYFTYLVFIICMLSVNLFSYEIFDAEIFVQGSTNNEVIYHYNSTKDIEGDIVSLSHLYSTPGGELFASETLQLKEGVFLRHETQFPFLEESSLLIPLDDRLEITFKRGEKIKSKDISKPDDLIFGPTQQDFIIDNLDAFKEGKKMSFSLPVPEFLTTMRFTMKKIDDSSYVDQGMMALEMKSNNIILWFIAKPIQYIIDETSGIIQEIHGPTILKRQVKNKWEFFDSDIYFVYE